MAALDSLPSDQRSVLELVLRRGKSYDEIAGILSIDRAGVRARALSAMDALGPQTRIPAERRALITDYLLGSLPDRVADEVRGHLAESAGERAWARVVASELQPIAAGPLPEIPGAGEATATPARAARAGAVAAAPAPAGEPVAAEAGSSAPAAPRSGGRPPRPSSRLGGAVILGIGALVVIAVVLVLLLTSGGTKHSPQASRGTVTSPPATTSATSATTTGTGTSTTTTTTPQFLGQVNLRPPKGGKALGVAQVLRQGRLTGVVIVAQGLAANSKHPPNAYAVWLYNSPSDSHILGFVSPGVTSNGRLHTAGGLPANAAKYQKLLITLESQSKPKSPGPIVLEGSLAGVKL